MLSLFWGPPCMYDMSLWFSHTQVTIIRRRSLIAIHKSFRWLYCSAFLQQNVEMSQQNEIIRVTTLTTSQAYW